MSKIRRSIIFFMGILFCASLFFMNNFPSYGMEVTNQSSTIAETAQQINVIVTNDFSMRSIDDIEVLNHLTLGNVALLTLKVPVGMAAGDFIGEIKQLNGVLYAEQDQIIQKNMLPNDPFFQSQWFHKLIQTSDAWDVSQGDSITVAVIDGGVDTNHPDLISQIVSPYNVLTQSPTIDMPNDHGTHVAGIIAAANNNGIGGSGIAPSAKVMPIKVDNGEGAYISDVITGIKYAVTHQAKIINLSLGDYQYNYALDIAIQYAYEQGLLIVASAGNDSTDVKCYPAAYNHVIAVGSINSNDKISTFSNYGNWIVLAAPGENILSTITGGKYAYMSGTSMASPMVAGLAALVWAREPYLTNDQVENRLIQTADDLGTPGKDIYYGYGGINAKRALSFNLSTGQWEFSQNHWYFYRNGKMQTGWVQWNGKWYYLEEKGEMATGWIQINGKWYDLNSSGEMQTGWALSNGKWYYLSSNGDMQTGWITYNNHWYYLNNSGEMETGWLLWNNHWYYLQASGEMQTGWLYWNDQWYYLSGEGSMQTGWVAVNNKWYYFYGDGHMAANTIIGSYKIGGNGSWIR